jgi:hypothetical protein
MLGMAVETVEIVTGRGIVAAPGGRVSVTSRTSGITTHLKGHHNERKRD